MTDSVPDLHTLLFDVRRSIRYHTRRRRFFDNMYRWKTWLALVFGGAAFVSLAAQMHGDLPLLMTALVSVVSALDLVIGSTTRARLHADLARRFVELEREIALMKDPAEEALRTWTAQRLTIEADEPPILRVLDILCHNELLLAMDYPRRRLCVVPWHKRVLAPFVNVGAESIRTRGEIEQQP